MARVFISHSSRDAEPAAQIKSWLAQQGFETPFLDFDKHAGIPPGADWERTLYREIDKSQAVIIIQTPNWMESKWCFAEFTQARALGKPIFPVIEAPTGDRLISSDVQALDLTRDREGGLEQLSHELTEIALDAQGGFGWDTARAPYPGLPAFEEEDAAIYFGRDDDIRRLIERLNARRSQGGSKLIALLGASGSGKSSLMRAGVLPRLKRSGRNWIVLPPMRPQARPLDEFACQLAIAAGRGAEWAAIRDALDSEGAADTLHHIASDLRVAHDSSQAQILLPVDQAEEVFSTGDTDQAERFLRAYSAALAQNTPFLGLLAMRSDFLGELQAAKGLSVQFEEFSLSPMPLTRIPQIITGPARVAGISVEDSLVQQVVEDAETEDALPLLAFALRELYDSAGGDNALSLNEYKALGDSGLGLTPLENAVRRAANTVLQDMRVDEAGLAALRDAFIPHMVRVNDQGEYVRQAAQWDALPRAAEPILEQLANARLLIIRQDEDHRMVEVAHEALLRKWPLLRGWLDEAREFLAGKQQIERDLLDWQHARDADRPAALLTGLKLNRARGWLMERGAHFSEEERRFIRASIEKFDADARRRARQRLIVTWSAVAASVVLAVTAGLAVLQWQETQQALSDLEAETRAKAATQDARAREQLQFVWNDLGSQQKEVRRLTRAANQLGVDPKQLVPRVAADWRELAQRCDTNLFSGFRHLYCSVRDVVSFEKIQAISGIPVFVPGGPHDDGINLKDTRGFGHYNPEFLEWADRYIIPDGNSDGAVTETARLAYEANIGPLVRALYHAYKALHFEGDPAEFEAKYQRAKALHAERRKNGETNEGRFGSDIEWFADVRETYVEDLKDGEAVQWVGGGEPDLGERFRWLADYLATAKDDDWYLANTAGGFWVRRSIDGTDARIFEILEKILKTFEPDILSEDS